MCGPLSICMAGSVTRASICLAYFRACLAPHIQNKVPKTNIKLIKRKNTRLAVLPATSQVPKEINTHHSTPVLLISFSSTGASWWDSVKLQSYVSIELLHEFTQGPLRTPIPIIQQVFMPGQFTLYWNFPPSWQPYRDPNLLGMPLKGTRGLWSWSSCPQDTLAPDMTVGVLHHNTPVYP